MEKRSSSRMLGNSKLVALVAAVLSLCLMGTMICQGIQKAQAAPTDLATNVSVQFPADATDRPDGLSYLMYKVADAQEQTGYDAYTFAPMASGPQILTESQISSLNATGQGALSASDFEALAQSAAGVIYDAAVKGSPIAATYNKPATATVEAPAGLYLVVPYGANTIADAEPPALYDLSMINALTKVDKADGTASFASLAYSDTKKFTFQPQLIALPTKDPQNGAVNTANQGPWLTDIVIQPKYASDPRVGSLTINKELITGEYNNEGIGNNTATFVFSIKGYTDEAHTNLVFDDVASVVIDTKNSTKNSTLVGNIPAGLYVVVTEIYTGISYEAVTVGGQNVTITATDSTVLGNDEKLPGASVTFQNTYNNTGNKGGSITNRFEYSNSDQNSRTSGGWDWSPLHDYEAAQAQGGDN